MTPGETLDIVDSYVKRERRRDRALGEWIRWLACVMANISGNIKRELEPKDLIKFEDEVVKVDSVEAREEMKRIAKRQMKKFPKLFKVNKDGLPKIYGEK